MWRQDMETRSLYWPFMRGIRRLPVDSPQYKGQSRELWGFLWFQPKYTVEQTVELQIDLRRYDAHHDVSVPYFVMVERLFKGCDKVKVR